MFERFTAQARAVVVDAYAHAERLDHPFLGCEHLLLAVSESPSPAGEVLRAQGITRGAVEAVLARQASGDRFAELDKDALAAIGIDLDQVRACVEDALGPHALRRSDPDRRDRHRLFRRRGRSGRIRRFTRNARGCLERALHEAVRSGDGRLGIEHVALALVDSGSPVVRQVLAEAGGPAAQVRTALQDRYRRAG